MRSAHKTFKIPVPLGEGFDLLRQPGQPLDDYPSNNAAIVGLMAYAIAFPRRHQLTAGLAKMHPSDQDLVHDFLLKCLKDGTDLKSILPKPATAEALLALARAAATKPSTKKQGSPSSGSVTP